MNTSDKKHDDSCKKHLIHQFCVVAAWIRLYAIRRIRNEDDDVAPLVI